MASQHDLTEARNSRFLGRLEPIYKDCERWAYSRTGNRADAEDVLAQSVLTGLQNIHQLKNDGAFKTWMFRIIVNTHRLHVRSSVRQPDVLDPEVLTSVAPKTEDMKDRVERERFVRALLAQLSEEQRQSLVLFELFNFSIKDVAGIMDKKEGTVRVLLHRARERLADILDKIDEFEI